MRGHSFIDGRIVPTDEARVPVDDVGFLRCFAIYEGITTVGNHPAFLAEHLSRLERSAAILGLNIPYTREELIRIITDMASYVTTPRGDIRLVLTGGRSADGITPSEDGLFYAIVNDLSPLPEELYLKGGKVITYEHQRFLPECKTTHYTTAAMLQPKKKEMGAIEVLYTKNGKVLEATTCNAFVVVDSKVVTAKNNVLPGITRMKTLQLAETMGIPIEQREVSLEELLRADELFLTSSYKDILPVTTLDERSIGDGAVGPITKRFMEAYQKLLIKEGITVPEGVETSIAA